MMAPWDRAIPTIGVAIGLVAVKAVILFPIALLMGLPKTAAGELAIVLGPGGEFALRSTANVGGTDGLLSKASAEPS
jgi:hypothetical protein